MKMHDFSKKNLKGCVIEKRADLRYGHKRSIHCTIAGVEAPY
jgi:hypothetical protein